MQAEQLQAPSSEEKPGPRRGGSKILLGISCLGQIGCIAGTLLGLLIAAMYTGLIFNQSIEVTNAGFMTSHTEITEGNGLEFINHATTPILLCFGKNQHCSNQQDVISDLAGPGLIIHSGESQHLFFSQAGTYSLTIVSRQRAILNHANLRVKVDVAGN